jgi:hypothetical protein
MTTYITLTNELLRRINEVTIDVTDFDGARNIQALAKDAINSSVRELMQSAQEWPFALVTKIQTMTVGTGVYSLPSDASSVDWESFYLKKLTSTNNIPSILPVISYVQYINNKRPNEDSTGTGGYSVPTLVYQTQESKWGATPIPNEAYEIEYKYWSFSPDLVLSSDVSIVPDRFKHVVIDGALMHLMMFRSNEQAAASYKDKFEQGIKSMRRLLLDDSLSMTSTMIIGSSFGNSRVSY